MSSGRGVRADDHEDGVHHGRTASAGSVRHRSRTAIVDDVAVCLSTCPLCHALLILDYGKGVCTAGLLRTMIARAAGVPVLADPARGRDWRDYEGCSVIKANRIEAAEALGAGGAPAAMARRLAVRHGWRSWSRPASWACGGRTGGGCVACRRCRLRSGTCVGRGTRCWRRWAW